MSCKKSAFLVCTVNSPRAASSPYHLDAEVAGFFWMNCPPTFFSSPPTHKDPLTHQEDQAGYNIYNSEDRGDQPDLNQTEHDEVLIPPSELRVNGVVWAEGAGLSRASDRRRPGLDPQLALEVIRRAR